jgi:hypothetical protein
MTWKSASYAVGESIPMSRPVEVAASAAGEVWAVRWILMLAVVYAASAVVTVRPVVDPDIWWHLRTGQWIVEHRAVPGTDPFSAYGMGSPWIAYSWLFGVGIYGLYTLLGHAGLIFYSLIGGLAVTSGLLLLVLRFEFRIPRAIALTAISMAALAPSLMPRAYLFTECFFIIEIYVLLAARETGRTRALWILPPVFALWANLHIQFVYGLLVLGMAAAEPVIVRLVPGNRIARQCIPLRPVILTAVACGLATLATPYGIKIYRPVVEIASQRLVYDLIIELGAATFRQPANWVFLAVVLAGAFSLGRQRQLQVFPALLFAVGAYLSFATRRDVWFLVVACVIAIAMEWGSRRRPRPHLRWGAVVTIVVVVGILVAAVVMRRQLSKTTLEAAVAEAYPAAAVAAIKERGYPGPLYNTFDWGGFLIWRLPDHRVSMDGRSNIHGDVRVWRSFLTSIGRPGWNTDEELRTARLIILPVNLTLTELLRQDAHYDVVYEDAVTAVFTRRESERERR